MGNRNSRKSGKNRRPQAVKGENKPLMVAMQGKRSSGAAGVHAGQGEYRRHVEKNQWKKEIR